MLISGTPGSVRWATQNDLMTGMSDCRPRAKLPERVGGGEAKYREQQGEQQTAQVSLSTDARPNNPPFRSRKIGQDPGIGQGFMPIAAILTEKSRRIKHYRQQRPPLQVVRIKPKNEADWR
jgi:hypothetical protein